MTISTPDIAGFRQESGGHRIQRVPDNEKRGRVHSSTVTVSVLFKNSEAETPFDQRGEDNFAYRWFSGTGKGGQKRNKVKSCLELTHIPTGFSQMAHGRSRESNAETAMIALVDKLNAAKKYNSANDENAIRKSQIGSGQRSDKRRTIRFQDDHITDHENGKTCRATVFMKGNIELLW